MDAVAVAETARRRRALVVSIVKAAISLCNCFVCVCGVLVWLEQNREEIR
jgi:hypothetical protein